MSDVDRSPLLNRFLSRSSSSNPTPGQAYTYSSPSTGSQGPSPTGATLPNSDRQFKGFSSSQRLSLGQYSSLRHQEKALAAQEVQVDGRPVSFSTDASLDNPLNWAATSSTSRSSRYDPIFLFQSEPAAKMTISASAGNSSGSMTTSNLSRVEYEASLSSEEPRSEFALSNKSEKKRPRWMSQVKNWLATSEPSVQAMKDQKKDVFKKHGVDFNDPLAAAKMHSPMGKVPTDAVTSTSGLTPEQALKGKGRAKDRAASFGRHGRGPQSSVSSSFSSLPSVKSAPSVNSGKGSSNMIAPWAE
ncbi:hypothetical protein TgHK011_005652 [Trichoderma gracile]|nr:hypothetical protein TgHK011_005652 [Trichoderma gracile]